MSLSEYQIKYMCEYAVGLNGAWSRKDAEALRDLALKALQTEGVRSNGYAVCPRCLTVEEAASEASGSTMNLGKE